MKHAAKVVPHLAIDAITYGIVLRDWKVLIKQQDVLSEGIPEIVLGVAWDVILVDAPRGHSDDNPGRMKSIYHASILARTGTDVFVHDCNREVEAVYFDQFLRMERLQGSVGRLRHYRR